MQTKELRVTYMFEFGSWALTHGGNVMQMGPKRLFKDRDELVGILRDEGLNVDFAGYIVQNEVDAPGNYAHQNG